MEMSSDADFDWEELPPDPDLEDDFGYEMLDLEVVKAHNSKGQFMFLPRDEDMVRNDAFVVADDSSVCDVLDHL
jgi:hypothetical protein